MRLGVGSKKALFNWKIILLAGIIFFALPFVFPQSRVSAAAGSNLNSSQFETWMTRQGFPESYKPYLRSLHRKHPSYVFRAQRTGLDWKYVRIKENTAGNSLVRSPYESYKSFENGCYYFSSNKYRTFDGSWNQAAPALVNYYLDPRNFLNENDMYMFFDQRDRNFVNSTTIRNITKGSFMYSDPYHYTADLYNAGNKAGVNANVIAAMILTEQGRSGNSKLISGNYKKYEGIYNYLNVGAYTTNKMSAVERGLWYAKGAGKKTNSYVRPWNSRYKAIYGGALYYKINFINNRQYTYYTKRFNVMNGRYNVGTHEYMTNIQGAETEARLFRNAYGSGTKAALTFYIPVYNNMPGSACAAPKKTGNNDNVLNSITVKSGTDSKNVKTACKLSPAYSRYETNYTVTVPKSREIFTISAKAHSRNAKISITKIRNVSRASSSYTRTIMQRSPKHKYQICVRSSSGQYRKYYLTIQKK